MTDFNNPTWGAEGVTDAKLNARIRDNMLALKDPPSDDYTAISSDPSISASSTAWGELSAFNLSLTTGGGDVLLMLTGNAATTGAGGYLDIAVDGNRQGGTDGILAVSFSTQILLVWPIQDLAAGDHDFSVYGKLASGGAMGFFPSDVPPQFVAREIS